MKTSCRSVILCMVTTLLSGTSLSVHGEVPPVLYSGPENKATFVGVDSVMTRDGNVDRSLFSQYDADTIRAYMQLQEEGGCVRLRGLVRDYVNMGPLTSTKEASLEATFVLKGAVVGQAQGFMGSEAGTLLEIDPEETLKGTHQNAGSSYYVFFPIGNFELAGRSYCAFNPDWPALPAVGEQVLLFIRNLSPSSSYLALLDGTDVIVLRKTGPDLPPRYTAERALKSLTSASIVEKVRSYLSATPTAGLLVSTTHAPRGLIRMTAALFSWIWKTTAFI